MRRGPGCDRISRGGTGSEGCIAWRSGMHSDGHKSERYIARAAAAVRDVLGGSVPERESEGYVRARARGDAFRMVGKRVRRDASSERMMHSDVPGG